MPATQVNKIFIEKDTFSAQFFNKPLNIGNMIYKKLEHKPNKKQIYNKIKNNSYATTFERIFNFSDIRSRIFKLDRGIKVDLENDDHFNKVCEMIEYFVLQDATVADVYTAEMASSFFAEILPITTSDNTKVADVESNLNSGLFSDLTNDSPDNTVVDKPDKGIDSLATDDSNSETDNGESNITDSTPYKLNLKLKSNRKVIKLYNDYNLIELIDDATDSNGENLKNRVLFYSESNYIRNNVFSGNAPLGTPLLPLEETVVIADELGLKHPTDPKINEPVVMTTDFLLTVDKGELSKTN